MRRFVLALYPLAWRERYGEELSALLEDEPPRAPALLDLARGALMAHLRRHPAPAPRQQMLGSVSAILASFIAFCFVGGFYAKSTENVRTTGLLGGAHLAIMLGAWVALGALVVAAAPLALRALEQAYRERNLRALVAAPPLAIGVSAATLGLLALARSGRVHHPDTIDWLLLALLGVAAVIGATVCWAAPRALLERLEISRPTLSVSLPALALVAVAMAFISVATVVYLIALPGAVGANSDGPLQLPMALDISFELAAMVVLTVVAALSARRGLGALAAER